MKRTILVVLAAALAFPAAALAHVTANPSEAPAGGEVVISFRVPHGCEESDTTGLSVSIPEGVVDVSPQAIPGWEVTMKEGKLPQPVTTDEGETLTEGVTEVTWTGGPLSHDQFADFGLAMTMPDSVGKTVWFPIVQRCEQGETRWIKIPVAGEEEPDTPAPGVMLVASSGDEHGAAAEDEDASAAAADESDDDSDGMTTVAIVLGAAGLAAGLAALGLVLFRRPKAA